MDAYPQDYVEHNLPLVYLSGLTTPSTENDASAGSGPLVDAKLPLVQSERREQLLQDFLSLEGASQAWNARTSKNKNDLIGFKFRPVGRVSCSKIAHLTDAIDISIPTSQG
jgi:trafficking protein particle complex subunit 11